MKRPSRTASASAIKGEFTKFWTTAPCRSAVSGVLLNVQARPALYRVSSHAASVLQTEIWGCS
ncbi:unnamed protein product [Brassica rapa subsp. narinosa]